MGKLSSFRNTFRRTTTDDTINQVATAPVEENKTDPATVETGSASKETGDLQEELPGEDLQRGVQDVEAVTLSWSKASLIAVFAKYVLSHLVLYLITIMLTESNSIWLLYFVNAFQSSILQSLIPFVTSDFESHSLLNVIYIVGDAMSAAVFIPLAKILDVWGRAHGYLFMTVCCTLGLVLMASCQDLSTFCAAYVGPPLPYHHKTPI
ncbi:hypothetical protein EIK77_004459 [Talaromyces pinophilus]|nr:hypothetical protein EIK77_004459 [Talaromyces pinophilus]